MKITGLVALLLLTLEQCLCANILAFFPLPSLSHYVMFQRVLQRLAQVGHEVDVVSAFPPKAPMERYNHISIKGSTPMMTNNFTFDLVKHLSVGDTISFITHECGTELCRNSFGAENMIKLKKTNKKYDLVITELFSTDCMLGWAWYFDVPSVVLTSSANLPWGGDRFGLPDNPSYIPTYFVEYGAKMSLFERIRNTLILLQGKLMYHYISTVPSTALAREFFGNDLPDLTELAYNTSLHLVNTHFSLNDARPLVPSVVEVAGVHIGDPKPVDKHFDKVLQTDKKGIIYFTTGSLVLSESFPSEILQTMFDAFGELPYKVVWKAKEKNFPKGLIFPKNIHFEPWMPQLDILCDPRVKLFVSHGGMMGTQETIYCGVPVLGLPIFADQTLNLKQIQAMGFAKMVTYETLTKDTLLNAAKELLENPQYASRAKQISADFKDRPLTPLDTAIYWIEYVIRHKGAPKLQSHAKNLAWYQYYLVDVMAVIIGVPCILIYLIVILIRSVAGSNTTKSKIKTK